MKNFKLRRTAAIIGYIVLAVVLFSSCGVESPNFQCGEHPFVVGEIKFIDNGLCRYTAKSYTFEFSESLSDKQSFISKEGLFTIGDTVRVCK